MKGIVTTRAVQQSTTADCWRAYEQSLLAEQKRNYDRVRIMTRPAT